MEFTRRQQWIDATVENNRLVAQPREGSCAGLLWEGWWISKLKYLFELGQSHLLNRRCFDIPFVQMLAVDGDPFRVTFLLYWSV